VSDRKNFLSIERAHVFCFSDFSGDRTNRSIGPKRRTG
jgi:hypothetical protein